MMKEIKFRQEYDDIKIAEISLPEHIFLPLNRNAGAVNLEVGHQINKFDEVVPGVISPVTGEIKEYLKMYIDGIETDVVKIATVENGRDEGDHDRNNITDEPDKNFHEKLKKSGYFLENVIDSDCDIVVSAVETDPLCSVSQQILRENRKDLNQNFDLFKKIFNRKKINFAVPEHLFDMVWKLQSQGVNVWKVEPNYPNGIPEILINSAIENKALKSPLYLKLEEFLNICDAAVTGRPNLKKVITVTDINGMRNINVIKGTPLSHILKDSDIRSAGKVVTGGPLRGYANFDLNIPVTDITDSVYVQYEKDVVRAVNNQCINCGRCNGHCPVNLSVNLLTRYSEFSQFENCRDLGVENCIECGLCSFYCPTGRSLVQLIRLAKSEIKNLEGEIEQ
ncbi:MAG: hypothetical protein KAS21_05110 [Candidatus Aminicenantes bacterium]|nr:hypothetical protein [Candidatus Aminicenantes bacterium]